MQKELKNILIVQKIPRIHIVTDQRGGRRHVGTAVEGRPAAVLPVVGAFRGRLPGGDAPVIDQVPPHQALVLDHRVPVQTRLLGDEHPVRVHGVELAQPRPVTLRKTLGRQITLEIHIVRVGHREADIIGAGVPRPLGPAAAEETDLVPEHPVAAIGLADDRHRRPVRQLVHDRVARARTAADVQRRGVDLRGPLHVRIADDSWNDAVAGHAVYRYQQGQHDGHAPPDHILLHQVFSHVSSLFS